MQTSTNIVENPVLQLDSTDEMEVENNTIVSEIESRYNLRSQVQNIKQKKMSKNWK